MTSNEKIMRLSLNTYQDFGVNPIRTFIFKDWVKRIETQHGLPIGIYCYYSSPTKIRGDLIFKETDLNYVKLGWYGKNKSTLNFSLPSFFRRFITNLPINPRTERLKHKKRYCKVSLSDDLTSIEWFISKQMIFDGYVFMEGMKNMYKSSIKTKINNAIKMVDKVQEVTRQTLLEYDYSKLNKILPELKYMNNDNISELLD